MPRPTTPDECRAALEEPFPLDWIKWKPQSVTKDNTKCMMVPYIDARCVMERLDDVFGPDGWSDEYREHNNGKNMICALTVRFPNVQSGGYTPVTREDTGGESEQDDEGDRAKAAFSDALKRAAVKFGVGRYLYDVPKQWLPYDAKSKRSTETPKLPNWALPDQHTKDVKELMRKVGAAVNLTELQETFTAEATKKLIKTMSSEEKEKLTSLKDEMKSKFAPQ